MMAPTPSVFVSHARADRGVAEAIARALEGADQEVWSDQVATAGAEWDTEVQKAVEGSDAVVLVISPDFLASSHSLYEAGLAIHRSRRQGGRLVPVLIGDADAKTIPLPLKNFQVLDARGLTDTEIAERVRLALREPSAPKA